MKKIIFTLSILLFSSALAGTKISQLPVGSASATGSTDGIPYVDVSLGATQQVYLWDLIHLPPMVATYAPLASPTFTGTITIPALDLGGSSTSGYCWKATNTSGAGAWGSCGSGTVSSVALTTPSWLTVSGSPITSSGTLAVTGTSESANLFLASPNGSSGAMTPRAIVAADVPTLNQNTTGSANTVVTNASMTGPISSSGNVTSITAQTGTGSTFVVQTNPTINGPTLTAPALGTPASGVATNLTGTASGLTAGNVTTNANLTGPITSSGNTTAIASQTGTGSKFVVDTSPTLVTPNIGTPSAGVATNLTGTASGLTAGNVTTNANLTGPITSSGNATSVASQTGTGSQFVMSASPSMTGDVGIGTTSTAVFPLQVEAGTAGAAVTTTDYAAVSAGSSLKLYLGAGTGNTWSAIAAEGAGNTITENLLLNPAGGNVGIGTTSPGYGLEVAGTTKLDGAVTLGTANTTGSILFASSSALSQNNADFFWDNTNLGLRIGTNLPLRTSAPEAISALLSLTSVPAALASAVNAKLLYTSASANTVSSKAGTFTVERSTSGSVTDTGGLQAMSAQLNIDVPTGFTYTNTNGNPNAGLFISSLSLTSGGSYAANYAGIGVQADGTAVTGNKTGIFVGDVSGGTNNASIADNVAYTGNYFINQSGTAPSTFGGNITVNGTGTNTLDSGANNLVLNAPGITTNAPSGAASIFFLNVPNTGGSLFFDNRLVGSVTNFRTSNLSTSDTTALSFAANGNSTFAGTMTINGGSSTAVTVPNGGISVPTGPVAAGALLVSASTGGGDAAVTVKNTAASGWSRLFLDASASSTEGNAEVEYRPGTAFNVGMFSDTLSTPIKLITGAGTTQMSISSAGAVAMPNLATSSAATTGTVCWTTSTGNLTVDTTLACLSSTGRVKEQVVTLGDAEGLAEVMKMRPVSYQLKKEFDPEHLGRQVGLIAEDVQKIDPRLVGMNSKGQVAGVRYMQMTAVLVKAIQEQQDEIESLKNELKGLQRRVR